MPLEVIKDDNGRAIGLKVCDCKMNGMTPEKIEGTERVIEADLIISAIGQYGDFEGLDGFDNGRGFMDTDGVYSVKGKEKHFAGGDIIHGHWSESLRL